MIGAGLPLRCVALEASGQYDTHAGEAAALSSALGLTAESLLAFQRDLEARGIADRVLTSSGRSSAAGRRRTDRAAPTTALPGPRF